MVVLALHQLLGLPKVPSHAGGVYGNYTDVTLSVYAHLLCVSFCA